MPFASIGHLCILYAALGQLWLSGKLHSNCLAGTDFKLKQRSRDLLPHDVTYVKKNKAFFILQKPWPQSTVHDKPTVCGDQGDVHFWPSELWNQLSSERVISLPLCNGMNMPEIHKMEVDLFTSDGSTYSPEWLVLLYLIHWKGFSCWQTCISNTSHNAPSWFTLKERSHILDRSVGYDILHIYWCAWLY